MCLLVGTAPPLQVAIPPFMLAFVAALVRGGQYLARDEGQFLIDFVTDALADRGAGDNGLVQSQVTSCALVRRVVP